LTKLDAATAKRVTADWAGAFPEFDTWKPLRLLRRIGPVVQGITLDRSTLGNEYFPTVHVHALTREFPVVSLTLGQRLIGSSGVHESVRFTRHDSDFDSAAQRLESQSNLPLRAWPTIEEIVGAYHGFAVAQKDKEYPPAVNEVEDSVLIPAAAGFQDSFATSLRLANELVRVWPTSRLPLDWKGAESWIEGLVNRSQDVAGLSAIVEGQIVIHKLSKVSAV
jgi:hypothetical protein